MSEQESHAKLYDNQMSELNRLINVAELVGLLILLVPMMFMSKQYYVFAVLALFVVIFIIYFVQKTSLAINDFVLRLPILFCLGITAGAVQLTPLPFLSIILLVVISVATLAVTEKFVYCVLFTVVAMVSYFVFHVLIPVEPILNDTFVNLASGLGVFFALSVHAYSWQYRYVRLSKSFRGSRNRFEHFVALSNKLAKYVPEQIWQEIIVEKRDVLVQNKRRKLTVFFSDIKGFTDLSERMSAEDLTYFLNDYFNSMSAIAKKHGATIDKFIGDALMVFFGDPHTKGEREDAIACVEMAIDMNRELSRLRNYWTALGFEGLHVRMGINTGYCHVGNFGSASRVSYTAIGSEVNLAARIQDAARENSIFISDATYHLVKHRFLCQKGKKTMLKGIEHPVQLWEVRRHRQGDEIKDARWVEYDLPGFHLHLNMLNIKQVEKETIRNTLIKASRVLDESIKKDKNQL